MNTIEYGKAICYSGYRNGQNPMEKLYPSYKEILEDLKILENDFEYIRMYDSSEYTRRTLEVIKNENINLKVMVTMDLAGEISNENCAWGGRYTTEQISRNINYNQTQLQQAVELADEFKDQIVAVAAGNEAAPDWNENLVSPGRILYFVKELKKYVTVPVTYCDNVHEWKNKLTEVAKEVDFISIHTYPVWEGKTLSEAIDLSMVQYNEINEQYPHKQVVITETGWPTRSNSSQIIPDVANEDCQKTFNNVVDKWTEKEQITCFFFEAFDESWKGSDNPDEPEKHWGYYYENRSPKKITAKK